MNLSLNYRNELEAYGFGIERNVKSMIMKKINKDKLIKAISCFEIKFSKSSNKEVLEQILSRESKNRPELLETTCQILMEGVKLPKKTWQMAQRTHYGIPFLKSANAKVIQLLLFKSCILGQLDTVPPHIKSIHDTLLSQKKVKEAKIKRKEEEALELHWKELMRSSSNADELFRFDGVRFFKEWNFTPKENTIVLHTLSEIQKREVYDYISHCIELLIIHEQPSCYDSFCNLIIGSKTNGDQITKLSQKDKIETDILIDKIKRKREEERSRESAYELEVKKKELEAEQRFMNLVQSVRSKAESSRTWDICGTWNLECPTAEGYPHHDSFNKNKIGSGFILEVCQGKNGNEFWGKIDLGFLVGVVKFVDDCRNLSDFKNTCSVKWAAREQGEGEMNFGDNHVGELTFSKNGTHLKGWLYGAFGRMNLTGDKIEEGNGHANDKWKYEWSTYNYEQYEYERVSRWG